MPNLPDFSDIISDIIWVVPGFLLIQRWNKSRPDQCVELSGWKYVFFVFTTGTVYLILSHLFFGSGQFQTNENTSTSFIGWVELCLLIYYPLIYSYDHFKTVVPICALIFGLSYIPFLAYPWVNNITKIILIGYVMVRIVYLILGRAVPHVRDEFYNKCSDCWKMLVMLTMKNGKAYLGFLWKYAENHSADHALQVVSVVPFKSGYIEENGVINWNQFYPEYLKDQSRKDKELNEAEVLIPRSEIVTLRKYSPKLERHFDNKQNKNK